MTTAQETARRFGRDVYLSKEEAAVLAKLPIVGVTPASAAEDATVAIREGDFVLFQVQPNTEGRPSTLDIGGTSFSEHP